MATVRADRPRTVTFRQDGRQRTLTTRTPAQAARIAGLMNRLGVERALEVVIARDGRDDDVPTFAEAGARHINGLTKPTEGTRERYRRQLDADFPEISDLPVDAITREHVADWMNARRREGVSAKTVKNKRGLMAAIFNSEIYAGHITANPTKGVALPDGEVGEMTFLTPDEFEVLREHIRPHYRPLVDVLVGTGLRWGEATALQVRDWDASHRLLTVSRAWKKAERGHVIGAPKSRKSRRTIPVPPQVVDALNDACRGRRGEDWIFVTVRGLPIRSDGHFHEEVWQPAVAAANGEKVTNARMLRRGKKDMAQGRPWLTPAKVPLGKRPRLHDLRHSCASWMIREGVTLPVIQNHLGHESIKTTIDRYGHLEPSHLQAAASALAASMPARASERPAIMEAGKDPIQPR